MSENILITGASSGFGKLMVQTLLAKGNTVFASMRGINGKNKGVADDLKSAGAHIVELDVTHDESVESAARAVLKQVEGLDVLVNNAGVGVIGLQETFTPEDWRHIFDINVFGVQRVVRAFLPHMREKKKGLLVFVTSLLGRFTLPFYGPYNASKWAMEALAENYRTELSGFGIESCLVEPGGFPTAFHANLVKPADPDRDTGYGEFAEMPLASFANFQEALKANPEQDPQLVADAVSGLISTPAGKRKFRTIVDKMGMGAHLEAYNDQLETITQGIYSAFGMSDLLKVKG
jgi:NAD(P)-dependent dehydrogenase (short-subunit alcohol dehydrogenase family)